MSDWEFEFLEQFWMMLSFCISLMEQMLEFPYFSELGSMAAGQANEDISRVLLCHPTIDLIMNTSSQPSDFFAHE